MLICSNGHRSSRGAVECDVCGCVDLEELVDEVQLAPRAGGATDLPVRTYELRAGDDVITLYEGDRMLVGRALESPLAGFLGAYPDVGRHHAAVTLARGCLLLDVKPSQFGTHVRRERLAEKEHKIDLPVTVRLGATCYLTFGELPRSTRPTLGAA